MFSCEFAVVEDLVLEECICGGHAYIGTFKVETRKKSLKSPVQWQVRYLTSKWYY